MRVAVIGSSSLFGSYLIPILHDEQYDVISITHNDINCGDPESVRVVLASIEPEVVINCAAVTDVEICQAQPEHAFRINALGALYVAQFCARVGSLCVYTSTDFVFDGEKGESYTEDDCPNPINVYGASKYAGEMLLRQACPQWLIVRMASLFGTIWDQESGQIPRPRFGHSKRSFVDTIIEKARMGEVVRVVDDIYMSPTYARDASRALERLVRQRATGIVHLANAGRCSWYELARETFEIVGLSHFLEARSSHDYPYTARRPKDSSLRSSEKNDGVDTILRPWQQAIVGYFDGKHQ